MFANKENKIGLTKYLSFGLALLLGGIGTCYGGSLNKEQQIVKDDLLSKAKVGLDYLEYNGLSLRYRSDEWLVLHTEKDFDSEYRNICKLLNPDGKLQLLPTQVADFVRGLGYLYVQKEEKNYTGQNVNTPLEIEWENEKSRGGVFETLVLCLYMQKVLEKYFALDRQVRNDSREDDHKRGVMSGFFAHDYVRFWFPNLNLESKEKSVVDALGKAIYLLTDLNVERNRKLNHKNQKIKLSNQEDTTDTFDEESTLSKINIQLVQEWKKKHNEIIPRAWYQRYVDWVGWNLKTAFIGIIAIFGLVYGYLYITDDSSGGDYDEEEEDE